MTFLNPAILYGLLSIALPIAIHILSRPRLRRIKWAATKFLLQSVQKNRRRIEMEDIILLILRCLLVALLVLLFARPALLTDASALQINSPATAVILVDNTASMGQSDGARTRFDEAKTKVGEILDGMGSGSSSALYLLSNHVKALIPKPTEDLSIVRRTLDTATITDGGGDLYPGIKTAVDVLKGINGAHAKQIFVLTDSQAPAWSELTQIRQLQDQVKKDITITFVILGDRGEDNVAITNIEMSGTVAAANQPLRCNVTVSNFGRAAVSKIPVKLSPDNEASQDEGVIDQIEPGASKSIVLTARFRDSGYHSLTASIGSVSGDRLAADNQRSLALLVIDQVNVLIVEGTSSPYFDERDSFFLSHALVPVPHEQVGQYYVKTTIGRPGDMENSTLSKYELIFLCNVAQLTPHGAQSLRQYVNQGGALVVFPGPVTSPAYYNTDPDFSTLLPAKLAPAVDASSGDDKYIRWQSKGYEHPISSLWNDADNGTLGTVTTTRYFPLTLKKAGTSTPNATAPGLTPPPAPSPNPAGTPAPTASVTTPDNGAAVVVKYADGTPAIAEQSVGKGKVILFSSTATTAWNTFPLHKAFVPFLIRIMSYATNGLGGNLNVAPGQPFATEIDSEYAGRDVSVLRPGETKQIIGGKVDAGDGNAIIRYSDTDKSGPYELFIGNDPKPKVVFASQFDSSESNLAQEPIANIQSLLDASASKAPSTENTVSGDQPTSGRKVPGKELWLPFAIAALCIALLELMLAHLFSQSK